MTVENPSALVHRPIPALRQWLGDGDRAEGFEKWVAENLARQNDRTLTDSERSFVRILNTITIASIECLRLEHENGRDHVDSTIFLARAMGVASLYALAGQMGESPDIPWRRIANDVIGEVQAGVNEGARTLINLQREGAAT